MSWVDDNTLKYFDTASEKEIILEELNDDMPEFLEDLKSQVFGAFQMKLDDFAENYFNYRCKSWNRT